VEGLNVGNNDPGFLPGVHDGVSRSKIKNGIAGCCSLLDSDPISRSIHVSEFVADHLAQFQRWNPREIENHSGFGSAFAELTQLRTFSRNKKMFVGR
jgi:hypothetical protein